MRPQRRFEHLADADLTASGLFVHLDEVGGASTTIEAQEADLLVTHFVTPRSALPVAAERVLRLVNRRGPCGPEPVSVGLYREGLVLSVRIGRDGASLGRVEAARAEVCQLAELSG
jgi:hypothetical protein